MVDVEPVSVTSPVPWPRASVRAATALTWASVALVSSTGRGGGGEQLLDDRRAVLGRLARPVDGFGHALAQVTVVVDAGEPQVGVGQAPQLADGVVGCAVARGDLVDEGAE